MISDAQTLVDHTMHLLKYSCCGELCNHRLMQAVAVIIPYIPSDSLAAESFAIISLCKQ